MDKLGKNVKNRKKTKEGKLYFPDEIIKNILIRLPVKSLVRFQLVCKKWRDIILDRDFIDLHQSSSLPLILVLPKGRCDLGFFGIDKWWDLSRTRSVKTVIQRFPFDDIHCGIINFSHAGLVVLEGSPWLEAKICILNPAWPNDRVDIFFCSESWSIRNRICAVYYHPLLKEYCSLWQMYESGLLVEYKLLVLSSTPSFKTIRNPFSYQHKDKCVPPLFINNHLYWMLISEQQEDRFGGRNDILEFDVISEEFKVISCPVPRNTECKEHQTHLVNIDGVISFILILPRTITIWRLEDPAQQFWTSIEYTPENCQDVNAYSDLIVIVDEKLAFESGGRFFVCNLMEGTVKNVPKRKWYNGNILFWSHQMTLASLKKCKSPLYIDKYNMVSWSGKSTV